MGGIVLLQFFINKRSLSLKISWQPSLIANTVSFEIKNWLNYQAILA